jgi:putative ABC transport system substrate-binding protein
MGRAPLALIVALIVLPLCASAQTPTRVARVGLLQWEGCPGPNSVFGRALNDLGYTWGEKIEVVCRSAEGSYQGLSKAADNLVMLNVDVIVGLSHVAAHAAHRATRSVPIVMIASGDPVRTNLVASLARPGGNVTGVSYYSTELGEKRLQLLKEIVFGMYSEDVARAARTLGLELIAADVRDPGRLERTFQEFSDRGAQSLLVLTDPMLRVQAPRIAALAAKHDFLPCTPAPGFWRPAAWPPIPPISTR